ncbi:DUF6397 family protein [Streptomyces sp. A3M-1-3]|uniref:DUF6397 family protein n=1 Tax=Streptomyces sp. A3M-1-3 TaxID=2962044 RepID=UPI0020B72480|nr:DUF6397 family protein [Streptomyces sp. A3M-1-3]MCP3818778.1 DUF6397 family protein [Streptomyces sp. A3M-1-3]
MGQLLGPDRAARELGLSRSEFALGVRLGVVRTSPEAGGEGPRGRRKAVCREEIERLRGMEGFPESLRSRVRTVGTAEGAQLLGISPHRMTRLARCGLVSPVSYRINRYRAVVWLYLAHELAEFAAREPQLLTGRCTPRTRAALDAGEDHRPRNWRGRRVGLLLRQTADPWVRAAALACVLDPVQLAEVIEDPYERAYLQRLAPAPEPGVPDSPAAQAVSARLLYADDPDELLWHRISVALAMDDARGARPAPRPGNARAGEAGQGSYSTTTGDRGPT